MAKVKGENRGRAGAFFLIGLRRPGNLVIIRQILLRNLFHQLDRITRAYAGGSTAEQFCRKKAIETFQLFGTGHCADFAQRG